MDPRDLNAGPDLQLQERVPIQNEVPNSRKNWGTDIKQDTRFKKNQGTDRKTKVPIRYRTKEKCGTAQENLKRHETDIRTKF
jgi:hypothetical protein